MFSSDFLSDSSSDPSVSLLALVSLSSKDLHEYNLVNEELLQLDMYMCMQFDSVITNTCMCSLLHAHYLVFLFVVEGAGA